MVELTSPRLFADECFEPARMFLFVIFMLTEKFQNMRRHILRLRGSDRPQGHRFGSEESFEQLLFAGMRKHDSHGASLVEVKRRTKHGS